MFLFEGVAFFPVIYRFIDLVKGHFHQDICQPYELALRLPHEAGERVADARVGCGLVGTKNGSNAVTTVT